MNKLNPRDAGALEGALDHFNAVIMRSVIDHDQLKVFINLRSDGFNRLGDIARVIE